jgi:hypothetical protein
LDFGRCLFEAFCHFAKHDVTDILNCVTVLNAFKLEEVDHGDCIHHVFFIWTRGHKQVLDLLNFLVGKGLENASDFKECCPFNLF